MRSHQPLGPVAHGRFPARLTARFPGRLGARVLTLIAALMLAMNATGGGHAHAARAHSGLVMIICSEDGPKTVVIDGGGQPVEPSGAPACADNCLCCPAPPVLTLPSAGSSPERGTPGLFLATFTIKPTVLAFAHGRTPAPRGPPSQEKA